MNRTATKRVQVTIRLSDGYLAAIQRIAKKLSRPGFEATRVDALRAIIAKGMLGWGEVPVSEAKRK